MNPLGLLSRTNAIVVSIPIGLATGLLAGWIAITVQGGAGVTFALFAAVVGVPFAALAAVLLGPKTVSDDSAEAEWAQRARAGAFVDLTIFLGIAALVLGLAGRPTELPVVSPIFVGSVSVMIRTVVLRGRHS